MHDPETNAALTGADGALARALCQGLNTPLAALRASVESLGQELLLGRAALRPLRIDGVLREVERIGKNVRELVELHAPPVPRPLACTLDEIIRAARAQLAPELRERVVLARCEPGADLHVDGPLLSGCLRRLLENALEATDDLVLIVARRDEGECCFTVLDDGSSAPGPDWRPIPFHSTKPNHIGLGLVLTQRDVALLGGRLELFSTTPGETCVRITIPSKEDPR